MNKSERFASVITSPGRGAIATVLVSGPAIIDLVEKFFVANTGRPLSESGFHKIVYGRWHSTDFQSAEDVVVCRLSNERVEIHCHGGELPPRMIAKSLATAGLPMIEWRDAVYRLEPNPWNAANQIAVIKAPTVNSADWLKRNADGRLKTQLDSILKALANPSDRHSLDVARQKLKQLQTYGGFGKRLIGGWLIAIAGRPNVGKSSLINRLLGFERAIVFDTPGTTRDIVSHATAFGGFPVRISDTAGLRQTNDSIEAAGVQLAKQTIKAADLMLYISDLSVPWNDQDDQAIAGDPGLILVHNKCDLVQSVSDRPTGRVISATCNIGIEELIGDIETELFSDFPPETQPLLTDNWQILAVNDAMAAINQADFHSAIELLVNPNLTLAKKNDESILVD